MSATAVSWKCLADLNPTTQSPSDVDQQVRTWVSEVWKQDETRRTKVQSDWGWKEDGTQPRLRRKKCIPVHLRGSVALSHRRLVRNLHRRGHKPHKTPHTSVLHSSNLHHWMGGTRSLSVRKLLKYSSWRSSLNNCTRRTLNRHEFRTASVCFDKAEHTQEVKSQRKAWKSEIHRF